MGGMRGINNGACSVDGCNKQAEKRGMGKHYSSGCYDTPGEAVEAHGAKLKELMTTEQHIKRYA